jgi:hypothetical protein
MPAPPFLAASPTGCHVESPTGGLRLRLVAGRRSPRVRGKITTTSEARWTQTKTS